MAQSQLNKTAEDLNIAANDLVGASRGTPSELAASSHNYNERFNDLLDAGLNMAGQSRVSTSTLHHKSRSRIYSTSHILPENIFDNLFKILEFGTCVIHPLD